MEFQDRTRRKRRRTIKYFAGNSQEENRYFTNSHIGERALREISLKGFQSAVKESQPRSIMASYHLLNGVHAANVVRAILFATT